MTTRTVAAGIITLALTLTGCSMTIPQEPTPQAPAATEPVTPAEPELTLGQQNAIRKAESYLRTMAFSRTGLIEQLEYSGFETTDAEYAADNIDVDWNEQAALKAQSYLDSMAFSRERLIDQLIYTGFTPAQAEHGATAVGY